LQDRDEGAVVSEAILIVPSDNAPCDDQLSKETVDNPVSNVIDKDEIGQEKRRLFCTLEPHSEAILITPQDNLFRGYSGFSEEISLADDALLKNVRKKGRNTSLAGIIEGINNIPSDSGLEFHYQSSTEVPHPDTYASQRENHQVLSIQDADYTIVREDLGANEQSRHPPEGNSGRPTSLAPEAGLVCTANLASTQQEPQLIQNLFQGAVFTSLDSPKLEANSGNVTSLAPEAGMVWTINQASIQLEPQLTQNLTRGADCTSGIDDRGTQNQTQEADPNSAMEGLDTQISPSALDQET
jgi:hypothetical protein